MINVPIGMSVQKMKGCQNPHITKWIWKLTDLLVLTFSTSLCNACSFDVDIPSKRYCLWLSMTDFEVFTNSLHIPESYYTISQGNKQYIVSGRFFLHTNVNFLEKNTSFETSLWRLFNRLCRLLFCCTKYFLQVGSRHKFLYQEHRENMALRILWWMVCSEPIVLRSLYKESCSRVILSSAKPRVNWSIFPEFS